MSVPTRCVKAFGAEVQADSETRGSKAPTDKSETPGSDTAAGEAKSVGLLGNAADVFAELVERAKAGGVNASSSPSRWRRPARRNG